MNYDLDKILNPDSDSGPSNSTINGKLREIFHDEDEKLVFVLGQRYLINFLNNDINASLLVLTSKRIYQKGRILSQEPGGRWVSSFGESVCDIKDIIGTEYRKADRRPALRSSVLFTCLAILSIIMFMEADSYRMAETIKAFMTAFLFFTVFFWIKYFRQGGKYFIIKHAGGQIASDVSRYTSEEELHLFQRHISVQKEKLQVNFFM